MFAFYRPCLQHAQSIWLLFVRCWMAKVFFYAGLTKIRDWETTLLLFTEEYRVPLLSPSLAAWLGTMGELLLPILLVLGLGTRFAALGLFAVNVVAVISYPGLDGVALDLHAYWGTLLIALFIFGGGRWSIDEYIPAHYFAKFCKK